MPVGDDLGEKIFINQVQLPTFRKSMACSRVVLVKPTKSAIASSVGSEAMFGSALELKINGSMYKHDKRYKKQIEQSK